MYQHTPFDLCYKFQCGFAPVRGQPKYNIYISKDLRQSPVRSKAPNWTKPLLVTKDYIITIFLNTPNGVDNIFRFDTMRLEHNRRRESGRAWWASFDFWV